MMLSNTELLLQNLKKGSLAEKLVQAFSTTKGDAQRKSLKRVLEARLAELRQRLKHAKN